MGIQRRIDGQKLLTKDEARRIAVNVSTSGLGLSVALIIRGLTKA